MVGEAATFAAQLHLVSHEPKTQTCSSFVLQGPFAFFAAKSPVCYPFEDSANLKRGFWLLGLTILAELQWNGLTLGGENRCGLLP